MRRRMHELTAVADLITPNMTEACILLGTPYCAAPLTRAEARSFLVRLSELGPARVVITGVSLASGERLVNIGYDKAHNAFWCAVSDYIPAAYPGTGDIYAAVLTGALLSGDSFPMAMDRATSFVELAIKTTFGYGSDPRHGVMIERLLDKLTHRENLSRYQTL
jgi:pyridoxine kinase